MKCAAIATLGLLVPSLVLAAPARERAIQQIPELMGRILESQEEIRERESELAPVVHEYDQRLVESKREIDAAGTDEQAADGEDLVPDLLGAETGPGRASQQDVLRIFNQMHRIDLGRLPIGSRHHDLFKQGFHAPVMLVDELHGQPVQEVRMRWRRALCAEVFERLDEAPSEKLFPETIDHHARRERVVGVDEPLGEAQPVARQVVGERHDRGRHVGRHGVFRCQPVAAMKYTRRPSPIWRAFLHDGRRHGGDGSQA